VLCIKGGFKKGDKMKLEDKIDLLNKFVKEWFEKNNRTEAKPKDLMPYLIEKEVYKKDNKNGNPLRSDLRKLKRLKMLHLIEYLEIENKKQNTYWNFKKK
jgi:hypothetical protein